MARIIARERGFETRNIPLSNGSITVGRSSRNAIVLKNRYASGEHCEITYADGECSVKDLGSTNGLFVNGSKVETRTLEDGDKILVGAALLIYIANEASVQPDILIKQLHEGSSDERELAANLLGQFGTMSAVQPLMRALKEEAESKVRAACAEALGLVGNPKVMGALLAYFDTTDLLLRNAVVRAIIRLADDKTVAGVSSYLSHEDKKVRALAAYVLGCTQNKRATDYLIGALEDEAFTVREAAIKALGDIADPKALDTLIYIANDHIKYPRVWVIDTLGKIRNIGALPVLVDALKSSDPEAREAAAHALGKLRSKEVIPLLIDALEEPDGKVRRASAASLEKLRRYFEIGGKFAGLDKTETILLSSLGEGEDGEKQPIGSPKYGEDRSRWHEWWLRMIDPETNKENV